MKKVPVKFLVAALGTVLLNPMMAEAASKYIWDSSHGFRSANNCKVTSQEDIPFYVIQNLEAMGTVMSDQQDQGHVSNGSLVKIVGLDQGGRTQHVKIVSTSNSQLNEGILSTTAMKELSNFVLQITESGKDKLAGHDLKDTLWQTTFSGDDYVSYLCRDGSDKKGYVVFNVFKEGQSEPIAEVGVSKADSDIFKSVKTLTLEEATKMLEDRANDMAQGFINPGPTVNLQSNAGKTNHNVLPKSGKVVIQAQPKVQVGGQPEVKHVEKAEPIKEVQALSKVEKTEPVVKTPEVPVSLQSVICTGSTEVRSENLKSVLFSATKNQEVKLLQDFGKGPSTQIKGKKVSFIKVQIKDKKGQNTGWVNEEIIKTRAECLAQPVPTPVAPKVEEKPIEKTPFQSSGSFDPLGASCARQKVLTSAKKVVANTYGNRPNSAGTCAKGVRLSLQASRVGEVNDGLGNAIDYLATIVPHGYVDSGIKDPNKAPPGAVIVLDGPKTDEYLRNHWLPRRGLGTYVGHVTIKGDDGYYYTDARTREVAMGWAGGQNRGHIRNVRAIFVPGEELVSEYKGKCPGMSN